MQYSRYYLPWVLGRGVRLACAREHTQNPHPLARGGNAHTDRTLTKTAGGTHRRDGGAHRVTHSTATTTTASPHRRGSDGGAHTATATPQPPQRRDTRGQNDGARHDHDNTAVTTARPHAVEVAALDTTTPTKPWRWRGHTRARTRAIETAPRPHGKCRGDGAATNESTHTRSRWRCSRGHGNYTTTATTAPTHAWPERRRP
jgi:hypothetical protein